MPISIMQLILTVLRDADHQLTRSEIRDRCAKAIYRDNPFPYNHGLMVNIINNWLGQCVQYGYVKHDFGNSISGSSGRYTLTTAGARRLEVFLRVE